MINTNPGSGEVGGGAPVGGGIPSGPAGGKTGLIVAIVLGVLVVAGAVVVYIVG